MFNLHKLYSSLTAITTIIVISAACIGGVQLLFYNIQKIQSQTVSKAIQVKVKDIEGNDFRELAKSVSDLSQLKIAGCLKIDQISPIKRSVLDLSYTGQCSPNEWLLEGIKKLNTFKTQNGMSWKIQYTILNNHTFNISLWTARTLILLIVSLTFLLVKLKLLRQTEKIELEIKHRENIQKITRQVGHDIKSPLTAIKIVMNKISELSIAEKDLLESAYDRMEKIASDLLIPKDKIPKKNKKLTNYTQNSSTSLEKDTWVYPICHKICNEKKVLFSHSQITLNFLEKNINCYAKLHASDLERILSNIINNSQEAIKEPGEITISLNKVDQYIEIIVEDNGKGIEKKQIPRLTEEGKTLGKKDGHGLGLYHANKTIQSWGGKLNIESEPKKGTRVCIKIPHINADSIIAENIKVRAQQMVFIIDDDLTIHKIWKKRFNETKLIDTIDMRFIKSPLEMPPLNSEYFLNKEKPLILLDYNFSNNSINGLDLAERFKSNAHIIFVTTEFYNKKIINFCKKNNAKLISKSMIENIKILLLQN